MLTYKASPLLFPLFPYVNHLWRWPCKHSQKCALLISCVDFNSIRLSRPYALTPDSDSTCVSTCEHAWQWLTSFCLWFHDWNYSTLILKINAFASDPLLPATPSSISLSACFSLWLFPPALCKCLQHLIQETCYLPMTARVIFLITFEEENSHSHLA